MGDVPCNETLSARASEELGFSRWWQLAAAVVMMGLVSPYKYVWASIQGPLARDLNISLPVLGVVFTLYVVFLSLAQFPAGLYRDHAGPRDLSVLAGVLAGGSYVGLGYATQVWQIYLLYSLGAVGVGIVYTVATNTALKWFPDRRGLTTGAGTMAFAAGSALFIPYVRANATVDAFPSVLRNIGLLICVGVVVSAFVLRDPPSDWLRDVDGAGRPEADGGSSPPDPAGSAPANAGASPRQQYTWRQMVGTWQFWVVAGTFACIAGTSFMLAANIVPFAERNGVRAGIATAATTALPLADGLGRLSIGGLSDRLGRERSMCLAFALCGGGVLLVVAASELGLPFVFLGAVILAAFFEGTQYTLVPSLTADYYGDDHSSANYAVVYTMELVGGIFGGVGVGWLVTNVGWSATFCIGGALAVAAAVGALVLRAPAAS